MPWNKGFTKDTHLSVAKTSATMKAKKLVRFLRGLFEAEGSLSIHLPTCTYNFAFSNTNQYLLKIVEIGLKRLEFHPEVRHNAIRIRRKAEVEELKNLLHFRQY
jgi:hypothetical protein